MISATVGQHSINGIDRMIHSDVYRQKSKKRRMQSNENEGDVLTDKFESVGVVEWQNGCFVVNFGDVDVFQISDCFDDSYQMWVIGNIHDNPEMLKGGE